MFAWWMSKQKTDNRTSTLTSNDGKVSLHAFSSVLFGPLEGLQPGVTIAISAVINAGSVPCDFPVGRFDARSSKSSSTLTALDWLVWLGCRFILEQSDVTHRVKIVLTVLWISQK